MMAADKTFVILTPGFAASEADTVCLPALQHFVRGLRDHRPDLNIVILAFQYPYNHTTYSWHGATVISYGGRNRGGIVRWHLRRKINAVLRSMNDEANIVGLLSFWYGECAWVGKRFADTNGIKHYCWIRGQDALSKNRYPAWLRPSGFELIALSDTLQREFERNHGIRPAHVIRPGINGHHFRGNVEKDIDLLAAGSLIPLKQYDHFIRLIADLASIMPQLRAVLVGEGKERRRLHQMIEQYRLQRNVQLMGELPHPEVLQLMQRSRIFIHPSSYEGFSGVCLEALSAGIPVVSYCQPMNYAIDNWHIVKSEEDMRGKTLQLLTQPASHRSPSDPFPISETVSRVMELY